MGVRIVTGFDDDSTWGGNAITEENHIDLALGRDEALVLFEMLADFHDQPALYVKDSAERLALIRLSGALQSVLVEAFAADYRSTVEAARSRLIGQFGTPGN